MKIKHNDIVIDPQSPFANCKLDREKYAKVLTSIVSTYADGFVLAINNEWGTGKTTFVKMWEQQLKNESFHTLYFNAWENDFGTNPLAALISEMKPLVKKDNEKKYKTIIEKGTIITKHVFPKVAKAIAAKYVDINAVADAIEGASEGIADILEKEVKDYAQKKGGLKEFRQALTSFVQDVKGDKPLIFIIDELDRCRPNYAVDLLEQVKHFFSVEGVVFVLSVDKEQLGNAVRGFYGSDLINSEEYLRRFIDVEYSIPAPDTKAFCKYLFEYFNFESFFFSDNRKGIEEFRLDANSFIEIASTLFHIKNLNLRQQEKLFAHSRIGLNSFRANNYVFPSLYLMLLYLKHYHPNFYTAIANQRLTPEQVISEFSKVVSLSLNEDQIYPFIYMEALLVFMYNNQIHFKTKKELLTREEGKEYSVPAIKSLLDSSEGQFSYVRCLTSFINSWDFSDVGINYLITKIDLVEQVIV